MSSSDISFQPYVLAIDGLTSITLAILLLFAGKGLANRVEFLRRYGIPEPVVGGLLCAVVVCVLYYGAGVQVEMALGIRDTLLLYFFAALGLNSNVRALFSGGRMLLVLILLSSVFIVLQNLVGMAMAGAFDMDPRAGLMVGSISLTGGVGTTLAWAPHFVDTLGVSGAVELGLATNMMGLIAACVMGGPIAGALIRRHAIPPSARADLKVGTLYGEEAHIKLDYYGVLLALFWLNLALILGRGVSTLIGMTGLGIPAFVGSLLAGILLRIFGDLLGPNGGRMWRFPLMQPGITLISDLSLSMFLMMALMGMKLWEVQHMLGFITVTLIVQIALVLVFTSVVVFRAMGSNYEAAVVCSAFGGISLGSTATALANMTAVTRQYGAAPNAFLVVPLVCGFFIDLANAVIISLLAR